jgi:hypothetical protein
MLEMAQCMDDADCFYGALEDAFDVMCPLYCSQDQCNDPLPAGIVSVATGLVALSAAVLLL